MADNFIQANPNKLRGHAKKILNECEALSENFNSIKVSCLDPLSQEWKSKDHIPVLNAFVEGLNSIIAFQKNLEDYAHFLEAAADEYDKMQSDATNESAKVR